MRARAAVAGFVLFAALAPAQRPLHGQDDTTAVQQDTTATDELPQIPPEDMREPGKLLTGSDLIEDTFPGSWPMFGKNTRMKIGGYVAIAHNY